MLLVLTLLAAAPTAESRLLGTWLLNGEPFVTLSAKGQGSFEGEAIRWKADDKVITVIDDEGSVDRVPYALQGDVLVLQLEGVSMQLVRRGAKRQPSPAPETSAPETSARSAPAAPAGPRGQLAQLLLSSNWCWQRYASGNTYTQRVHFNADGTWVDSSESDIYAANAYAATTAEATSARSSGGRWEVRGDQLFLSSPEAPALQPTPYQLSRNSNGYPLITVDDREYFQCR